MTLEQVTANLREAIDIYDGIELNELDKLSEALRILDVNLTHLVHVRDEYYKKFQSVYFNSQAKTDAAKNREAQQKVPELDLVRKILKHYGEVQHSIRTQISLRKSHG